MADYDKHGNPIENTSEQNPARHLIGMITHGTEDYITNMEAEGQTQMVHSSKMPVDLKSPREEFEALGFTFGEANPNDDLFMEATLPEGWEKQGTDHSMWSRIVDERGVERVAIFYKAAFYDRHAHASIINVGQDLASKFIYGEDIPDLDLLTNEERVDFVAALDAIGKRIEEHPDIYGDQAEKLAEARTLAEGKI